MPDAVTDTHALIWYLSQRFPPDFQSAQLLRRLRF